jgi:hypothetical protein
MCKRILLIGVLVVSLATAASGFNVGMSNGALYTFGGPPQASMNFGAFGNPQVGGGAFQMAGAFNPGGVSWVDQQASAQGGQIYGPGFQAQGFNASLGQTMGKIGGIGGAFGMQGGEVHMNQPTPGGMQSTAVVGTQTAAIGGGPGVFSTSTQNMNVTVVQASVQIP